MSIMTTSTYDFVSDLPYTGLAEVCEVSDVSPVSAILHENTPHGVPYFELTFKNRDDAIRFTEVYLDSDDSAEIQEYL